VQNIALETAIPLELIHDNPFNSRKFFEQSEIRSLADSMSKVGLLNPVKVRETDSGFELVHGHRRVRAARLLKWSTIQATIATLTDEELLLVSLIENLEREDLSDYEKALAFRRMHDDFTKTEEQVGELVGLSKAAVSNYIHMTKLFDEELLAMDPALRKAMYSISEHHSRYLSRIGDAEARAKMLKLVVSENLSVRDLQRMSLRLRSWFGPLEEMPLARDQEAGSRYGGAEDILKIRNLLLAEFKLPKAGDFKRFADFHDFDNGFSIYSDFPPFRRIVGPKAMAKERDWFDTIAPHLTTRIRDIRVQFFADTALATLYVDQKGKVKGRRVKNVLRGTVLFARRGDGWRIVHEHWSKLGE
jgi:ParB/RepB/Spo0J family partition protein